MNPWIAPEAHARDARTAFSVNLNKVALLRNARPLGIPSLTRAAQAVLAAGAQGITVHPRPDQRHIRDSDVPALAQVLREWPAAEFNIEGNPFHNLMPLVEAVRPQQVTFVPDTVAQATSDHGWCLPQDLARLQPLVAQAQAWGVRVSLFMDPDPQAMTWARQTGADRVELYTEAYARAHGSAQHDGVLAQYVQAAQAAVAVGLGINAGHDLNLHNLSDFLRALPWVQEVSIGHAFVADALDVGYAAAVKAYQARIQAAWTPGVL